LLLSDMCTSVTGIAGAVYPHDRVGKLSPTSLGNLSGRKYLYGQAFRARHVHELSVGWRAREMLSRAD
jgi:hypothetical protein